MTFDFDTQHEAGAREHSPTNHHFNRPETTCSVERSTGRAVGLILTLKNWTWLQKS